MRFPPCCDHRAAVAITNLLPNLVQVAQRSTHNAAMHDHEDHHLHSLQAPHDTFWLVRSARERLEELIPKLCEASAGCSRAAQSLAQLEEMSLEQQRQLADQIRAADQQWAAVVAEIDEALTPLRLFSSAQR